MVNPEIQSMPESQQKLKEEVLENIVDRINKFFYVIPTNLNLMNELRNDPLWNECWDNLDEIVNYLIPLGAKGVLFSEDDSVLFTNEYAASNFLVNVNKLLSHFECHLMELELSTNINEDNRGKIKLIKNTVEDFRNIHLPQLVQSLEKYQKK